MKSSSEASCQIPQAPTGGTVAGIPGIKATGYSCRKKSGGCRSTTIELTDDDLNVIEGRREQLEGKLQQRYGFAKDQIHRDVDDWFRTLK